MQKSLILKTVFKNLINTGIVNKVYHSVIIENKNGINKPMANINGRYKYVGVDDTDGFSCYFRQVGQTQVDSSERIGGSTKRYKTRTQMRVVFFNDSEKRNHEQLLNKLVQAIIGTPYITFISANTLKDVLLNEEAPNGKHNFKKETFYCSIDFFVFLILQTSNCEEIFTCADLENPYCGDT